MRRMIFASALLAIGAGFHVAPATAAEWCFEGLGKTGCPWKEKFSLTQLRQQPCEGLRHIRNSIYDRHDYCFKDPDLAEMYNNDDCTVHDASKIKFNGNESTNISRIVKVEKEKSCKKPKATSSGAGSAG